mmetsp:Transcript_17374/g.20091  ORF Transcript_17374/g.20091 Transcript_17374/m.20091 type:complete len:754 (+) Transcript_17374:46-2307(+)
MMNNNEEESNSTTSSSTSLPDPDDNGFNDFFDLNLGRPNNEDGSSSANNRNFNDNNRSSPVMDGHMSAKVKPSPSKTDSDSDAELSYGLGPRPRLNSYDSFDVTDEYILGTLIVRVVTARDLKAVEKKASSMMGSLKEAIFSSRNHQNQSQSYQNHGRHHHHSRSLMSPSNRRAQTRNSSTRGYTNHFTSNPYANVSFTHEQVYTSSTVYESIDPSFPRNEVAYFDVSLPISHLVAQDQNDDDDDGHQHETLEKRDSLHKTSKPLPSPLPIKQVQPPILNITMKHNPEEKNEDYYNDLNSKTPKKQTQLSKSISSSTPIKKKQHYDTNYDKCKKGKTKNLDNDDECDEFFLGKASIDVTQLITGKISYLDEWIPLVPKNYYNDDDDNDTAKEAQSNTNNDNITGQVRIICEYEITDTTPRPGDYIRFNGYVNPIDIYPIPITQIFRVDDTNVNLQPATTTANTAATLLSSNHNNSDKELLLLSYKSNPEDWYCTFVAHRNMFISVERHYTAVERYQTEIITLVEKIITSPAAEVVTKTVEKLPEEGLIYMGLEASMASMGLVNRWWKGGIDTVVNDFVYATNLDGAANATNLLDDDIDDVELDDDIDDDDMELDENLSLSLSDQEEDDDDSMDDKGDENEDGEEMMNHLLKKRSSSNSAAAAAATTTSVSMMMPCCPISGESMKKPVVAADGHTYEAAAIKRWLRTSNISPLTGSILPHKKLVPNYLLISTFQDGGTTSGSSPSFSDVDTGGA